MSTKRLRRTVVEGGKRRGNTDQYREGVTRERHRSKIFCDTYVEDAEYSVKRRPHHYREFADRLAPLYRWLQSHIGERWDDVYSLICKDNDIRSIKGWHLRGHVEGYVTQWSEIGVYRYGYRYDPTGLYVDQDGILREAHKTQSYVRLSKIHRDMIKSVISWTSGMLILPYGKEVMWYVPVRGGGWVRCHSSHLHVHRDCPHRAIRSHVTGQVELYCQAASGFRQAGSLTRAQLAYWKSLPVQVRSGVVSHCMDSMRYAMEHYAHKNDSLAKKDVDRWFASLPR